MTPLGLDVRRAVYDGAINSGSIHSKAELASSMRRSEREITEALGQLADAHVLVLQRDGGEILMANPFSSVPTPFIVRIGARQWYGNCIWDGMGIAAMLHAEATLEASCGCCGSAIVLALPGDCRDDDARVAHFAIPSAHWWDDIVFN
jgi:Alkylmercury lyase